MSKGRDAFRGADLILATETSTVKVVAVTFYDKNIINENLFFCFVDFRALEYFLILILQSSVILLAQAGFEMKIVFLFRSERLSH